MEYKNLDLAPKIINGHYQLTLTVGNIYEIHYGVHQGLYEYVGKVRKDDPDHIHFRGAHLFKQLSTGKITFSYFGYSSPYEFTNIIHPHKN